MKKYILYFIILSLLYISLPLYGALPEIDMDKADISYDDGNLSKVLQAKRKSAEEQQRIFDNKLFKAVRGNDIKAADAAIKAGANINARLKAGVLDDSYENMTPLCLAAYDKNAEMVKFLISNGADLDAYDSIGFTPLIYAVYGYNKPVVTSIVKDLLLAKANPNAPTPNDYTPLMKASEQDLPEVIDMLISFGADVNARNRYGFTPIDLAADGQQINNIGKLLMNGSKLPQRDVLKAFALETAVSATSNKKNLNKQITLMLLKKGINPNIEFFDGTNALLAASILNKKDIVEILLKNGADVNKSDHFGVTPLMAAAMQGNADIINLLFKYGADKTKRDSEHKTAFDYAVESGQKKVLPKLK